MLLLKMQAGVSSLNSSREVDCPSIFFAALTEYHRLGNLQTMRVHLLMVQAWKSKNITLASGEGLRAVSSQGEKGKGKKACACERKEKRKSSFY